MTIKKRLFISNILMLVMPIVITCLVAVSLVFAFVGVGRKNMEHNQKEEAIYEAFHKTKNFMEVWSSRWNIGLIKEDIESFNERYEKHGIQMHIYQEQEPVYPEMPMDSQFLSLISSQKGEFIASVSDNYALYQGEIESYTIFLTDRNFNYQSIMEEDKHEYAPLSRAIMVFILIIIIIFVTNRLLTHFVFKSIIVPLDTLLYGVHQIRDGNLKYRILYEGKDEFSSICKDFNEMAQQLMESVYMRQKDEKNRKELIAGISHDLRTPMTSIKAYVEGIEKGVASTPETQRHYLKTIRNKTEDLEYIINQLFLFSKMDIGEFPLYLEKVEIETLLSDIVDSLSTEYKKRNLSMSLTPARTKTLVQLDQVQFRNVIMNILENSAKYKEKEEVEVRIWCIVNSDNVIITLSDDGPGVSGDSLDQLFEVFYRGDRARSNPSKGSGLGLAITAKILEKLGGSIHARNTIGSGLAIVITIPKYLGGKEIETNTNRRR